MVSTAAPSPFPFSPADTAARAAPDHHAPVPEPAAPDLNSKPAPASPPAAPDLATSCLSACVPSCLLPAPDAALLSLFLELNLNLHALAARTNLPVLSLLAWTASPPIREQLDALARLRQESLDQSLAEARRTAIHTLSQIAADAAADPIERRRAATVLLRLSPSFPSPAPLGGGGGRGAAEAGGGGGRSAPPPEGGGVIAAAAMTEGARALSPRFPPSSTSYVCATDNGRAETSPATAPTSPREGEAGSGEGSQPPHAPASRHTITPSSHHPITADSPDSILSQALQTLRTLPAKDPVAATDALSPLLHQSIRSSFHARRRFALRLDDSFFLKALDYKAAAAPAWIEPGDEHAAIVLTVDAPRAPRRYTFHFTRNPGLSSTVGSEAWNSRDLKSRPH